jgi:hypothetical protein
MSYMLSIVSKCSFSISMYSYEFILTYILTNFSGPLIPITLQTPISIPPWCFFFLFYILLIDFLPSLFTYERSFLSHGTNFCFARQEKIVKIILISNKKTLHALSLCQSFCLTFFLSQIEWFRLYVGSNSLFIKCPKYCWVKDILRIVFFRKKKVFSSDFLICSKRLFPTLFLIFINNPWATNLFFNHQLSHLPWLFMNLTHTLL